MKFDREGAINNLGTKDCFVCGKIKSVYVVVTIGGKLHLPCCSDECMGMVADSLGKLTNLG